MKKSELKKELAELIHFNEMYEKAINENRMWAFNTVSRNNYERRCARINEIEMLLDK